MADINSAAVSIITAAVNAPTPLSKLSPSTTFMPTRNGVTFNMNEDKFVPISGNPDDTPAVNPPTILPTNLPIAYPMVASSSPPSAIIS